MIKFSLTIKNKMQHYIIWASASFENVSPPLFFNISLLPNYFNFSSCCQPAFLILLTKILSSKVGRPSQINSLSIDMDTAFLVALSFTFIPKLPSSSFSRSLQTYFLGTYNFLIFALSL